MAVGVDFKNIFNKTSGETSLISGEELIQMELGLLLNFKRHSLFFGNSMGLDCERFLSLANKAATFNLIKSEIDHLFYKYKRAYIKKIEMKFNGDTNSIDMEIECGVSGSYTQSIRIPISIAN